jgi:glycosyltransferase involved in cell wall biosynthesis
VKFSFIITTKNEEKHIRNTCLSIRIQNPKIPKEIILVDACSNDATVEIAKPLVDKLIIKESNISQGKNIGAKASQGEILVFVNADVILAKDWIDKVSAYFKDKSIGAVHGLILPMENSLRARIFTMIWNLFILFSSKIKKVHTSGETTLAVRKELFFKINGFREDLTAFEDIDFGLRLSKITKIKLAKDCKTIASLRRFEKEGYLKWSIIWILIGLYYFLRKKNFLEKYPIVR